jgi:hypothetical protein
MDDEITTGALAKLFDATSKTIADLANRGIVAARLVLSPPCPVSLAAWRCLPLSSAPRPLSAPLRTRGNHLGFWLPLSGKEPI